MEELLLKCEQAKDMYNLAKQDITAEKVRSRELEGKIIDLQKQIAKEQTNLDRAKEQYEQIESKFQALEKRSSF